MKKFIATILFSATLIGCGGGDGGGDSSSGGDNADDTAQVDTPSSGSSILNFVADPEFDFDLNKEVEYEYSGSGSTCSLSVYEVKGDISTYSPSDKDHLKDLSSCSFTENSTVLKTTEYVYVVENIYGELSASGDFIKVVDL